MGEIGKVLKAEKNKLTVSLTRTEACAKCGACAAGLKKEEMLLTANNMCDAQAGDYVVIELEDGYFAKAIGIMYGIPLAGLLLGFFMGYYGAPMAGIVQNRELIAFGLGIICLLCSYLYIGKNEKKYSRREFTPSAVAIVVGLRNNLVE